MHSFQISEHLTTKQISFSLKNVSSPLSLPTAKVRKFSDETLDFRKSDDFENRGAMAPLPPGHDAPDSFVKPNGKDNMGTKRNSPPLGQESL